TCLGGSSVQHLGDVGMVHQRQRLALRFEAADNFLRIHASLDNLERDFALYWFGLLRQENSAKPSLSEPLEQLVTTDHHPRPLYRGVRLGRDSVRERFFLAAVVGAGHQ